MLIVMTAQATAEDTERVRRKIESLGFRANVIPGAQKTAIGVTGNQGALDPQEFDALPGVAEAIRCGSIRAGGAPLCAGSNLSRPGPGVVDAAATPRAVWHTRPTAKHATTRYRMDLRHVERTIVRIVDSLIATPVARRRR